MDSHKTHKAFVQMAKWLEQTLGHNEYRSAPSLYVRFHLGTYVKDQRGQNKKDICTFWKHKNKQ